MHVLRRLIHPLNPIDRHSGPASKFDHPDLQIRPQNSLLFCQVVILMLVLQAVRQKGNANEAKKFRAGDATVTPIQTEKLDFPGE